ncbi:hypothetical protein [Rhizobium rhizogenes]|nr:hypothetical protein [Rhizobium rhizogenes]MCZ7488129.1 hypothetical protein [Rhizobium rhizogenes]
MTSNKPEAVDIYSAALIAKAVYERDIFLKELLGGIGRGALDL